MSANSKRDRLRKLIEGIDVAMFTTYGEGGYPVSRPLSTQDTDFDGEVLWFFVRRSSAKVREIARNPKVNVAYASKDRNAYVSVAGTAKLVDDPAKADELWSDALKAYFKRGRNDPDLALIRVRVATAEFWEGPSTGIGKMIAFLVARATRDDAPMSENRFIRMRPKPAAKRRGAAKKPAARARKATAKRATKSAASRTRRSPAKRGARPAAKR